MAHTNGEFHGTVKRERDTALWAFRWALGILVALGAWVGLEVKVDTKATNAKLDRIATEVAVAVRDVGRHEEQITRLGEMLRQIERRQDMRP